MCVCPCVCVCVCVCVYARLHKQRGWVNSAWPLHTPTATAATVVASIGCVEKRHGTCDPLVNARRPSNAHIIQLLLLLLLLLLFTRWCRGLLLLLLCLAPVGWQWIHPERPHSLPQSRNPMTTHVGHIPIIAINNINSTPLFLLISVLLLLLLLLLLLRCAVVACAPLLPR